MRATLGWIYYDSCKILSTVFCNFITKTGSTYFLDLAT